METIARYGDEANKARWLKPLLEGKIRSAFAMTEPEVASSDATNIATRIERQGDEYVINGHKWWISGAADPRCAVYITMGKTDPEAPRHSQQSMVLVPADAKGMRIVRPLNVMGYDDAPHGHVEMYFENVRVPVSNILLGEGRGFEIAQGRLGPGRIHHCMRLIGLAERALELMCKRASSRTAFGKTVAQQTVTQERIAEARCKIDMARLLTLKAAWMMDVAGNKVARTEIAMIKVVAPSMACQVIDWAMQVHGGGGMCDDFPLAYGMRMHARCALPTARTKCTATPLPSGSWASTAPTAATPRCRSRAEADQTAGRYRAMSVESPPKADSQALVKIVAACCSVDISAGLYSMRR
jgi:acyl-CoA dehydrogenase